MTAILAALLLAAGALGLDAWLLRGDGAADVLTPTPEKVVQGFVGHLAARRPESAETLLAEPARDARAVERMRAWAATLHARHGDFRFAEAETTRAGDAADVRASLRTARDGAVERHFQLRRDPRTRLWKITRFDPQT
jgi:hypothetical protein